MYQPHWYRDTFQSDDKGTNWKHWQVIWKGLHRLGNISNYSSHHVLGTLADQLVRMLYAATAKGDDCQRDGEADQQHPAVDVKPE